MPEETARVAKAAFPKGNLAIFLRDELEGLYNDELFADLYPERGKPAEAPWRLAIVTILQFAEDYSDREAADAVRSKIDWKYALGLELTDTGFDFTVLSKFRKRLDQGGAEHRLLDELLKACQAKSLIRKRGNARTDSTHVLAKVRALNRLGSHIEAMRVCLNSLATLAPEWLKAWVPEDWYERYSKRFESFRSPKEKEEAKALADLVGTDGFALLAKVYHSDSPFWLAELEAVELLRQMWLQQFWLDEGQVKQRESKDLPPASLLIASPYDADARLGIKRDIRWTGYKIHVTETCDDHKVNLIIHVETAKPNRHDNMQIPSIHEALKAKELLPEKHIVDMAYMDTELMVKSQKDYGVSLHGRMRLNHNWRSKTDGAYQVEDFSIDWSKQKVTCPDGKQNLYWYEGLDRKGNHPEIKIFFDKKDCLLCEQSVHCHRSKQTGRSLCFPPQETFEARQLALKAQETPEWQAIYQKRAGIEGTLSQGIRAFGMRRSRYIGHVKTHFQNEAIATAINIVRLRDWFALRPRAETRVSRFGRLAA
ncbi:MAG: IS1182 family transposase [Trueperaceae bacterium]|nr:IS1182 family transposase [Trueperaceae bacterium]